MSDALNKVNQQIKELAAKYEEAITIDEDGDSVVPETFVQDNLSLAAGNQDLTLETVTLVQTAESNLASALALGLANAGRTHMTANKESTRVTGSLGFGHNTIRASVDRESMVRVPGKDEPVKKYGAVSVRLDSAAAAKKGDLKRIVTHVNESFTASFGK